MSATIIKLDDNLTVLELNCWLRGHFKTQINNLSEVWAFLNKIKTVILHNHHKFTNINYCVDKQIYTEVR